MVCVKPLVFWMLLGLSPWALAQQNSSDEAPELAALEQEAAWTPPPPPPPRTQVERRNLRLEVVQGAEEPQALPLTTKGGWLHAALPSKTDLGLRLTNTGEGRLLVVVSINGMDPFTGRRAYQGQPGKVIEPGQSVVMRRGKFHKKADFEPILPANKDDGAISVAIFEERTDYPLVLPNMEPPPFGPENYKVGKDGVRRWVPPPRYPFRKVSAEPSEFLFVQYSLAAPASSSKEIAGSR